MHTEKTPSLRRLDWHYIAMQMGFWAMFAAIVAYQTALLLDGQGQGGLRGAVRPLDVEGDAFPGPVRRQGKGQDVHPFGVLAAQMEPRRAGEEVGAARKLPGCDFDVHHVWIVPFPGRCGAPF